MRIRRESAAERAGGGPASAPGRLAPPWTPSTLHITIDRPREEVFDYLADIANHPEFTDHYLKEWRLTRIESSGRGAGARFRADAPLQPLLVGRPELHRGRARRTGSSPSAAAASSTASSSSRAGRSTPAPGGGTRIEFVAETEPRAADRPVDRGASPASGAGSAAARNKALKRLRAILEENRDRGARATVAGR